MLTLIIVILVLALFLIRKDDSFGSFFGVITCSVLSVFVVLAWIGSVNGFLDGRYIDSKILLYEDENKKIEEQITASIKEYQTYEQETYKEFKPENAVFIVNAYPDLKSDALVAKQIDIYISNSEHIKSLKLSKINQSKHKFWLWFGN